MHNDIIIEQVTHHAPKATLSEVASYLSYLKHVNVCKPDVSSDSINIALAIAKGLGDINNFGTKAKHKPLFAGGKTFHRNNIDAMKAFFKENKLQLLALKDELIETYFSGCDLMFATELANGFSSISDVSQAYSSLYCDRIKLSSKQILLRNTMIANLLSQILVHTEKEYDQQQMIA